MNEADARALAEFVHDHDKRYQASPQSSGIHWTLLLTQVFDGTPLPPLLSWQEYEHACLDADNPGPTVRAAWGKWIEKHKQP